VRAILTYHSIDSSDSPISVRPEEFARHVDFFRSGRVRVTSVAELLSLPGREDAVAITFDDGFANFGTEAFPRLDGLPVTLFVVTDHVGRTNAWGGQESAAVPTMPLLDWDALGRLAERGVTMGAHTRTHPDLTALSIERVEEECRGSAERLRAELGVDAEVFAYPYGKVTPAVASIAARSFRCACTARLGLLTGNNSMTELPRLDMYYFRERGLLESWGSAWFRAYLKCRQIARHTRHVTESALSAASRRRA
jgi:peptidoglycan/xylan/chitin deacetylase (PgdA/CDA1 family)